MGPPGPAEEPGQGGNRFVATASLPKILTAERDVPAIGPASVRPDPEDVDSLTEVVA